MERFLFLDDVDRALVDRHRGDHNRLGVAVQLGTVRFLGTFLTDPLEVPAPAVAYVAEQLGIANASCFARYGVRRGPRQPAEGCRPHRSAWEDLLRRADRLAVGQRLVVSFFTR